MTNLCIGGSPHVLAKFLGSYMTLFSHIFPTKIY